MMTNSFFFLSGIGIFKAIFPRKEACTSTSLLLSKKKSSAVYEIDLQGSHSHTQLVAKFKDAFFVVTMNQQRRRRPGQHHHQQRTQHFCGEHHLLHHMCQPSSVLS